MSPSTLKSCHERNTIDAQCTLRKDLPGIYFRFLFFAETPLGGGVDAGVVLWLVISAETVPLWHKYTIDFEGPDTSETASPNPFTYYRLDVTFTQGGKSYVVPGYYAADGDAANSSAESGNKWRVHFAPDAVGEWTWKASFRKGEGVATADSATAGEGSGFFDGTTGSLTAVKTDKSPPDMRARMI